MMYIKHDFNADQFAFLLQLAEQNNMSIKRFVENHYKTILSDLMEHNNNDTQPISGDCH